MARTFVAASSQKLENASAVLTAVPCTMACWVNMASAGVTRGAIVISDGTTNNRLILSLSSTGAVSAISTVGGVGATANSSTTIGATGTWFHVAVVFASATSRAAYLNGGGKGTNATSSTPTGLNLTAIGHNGGGGGLMDGSIAWPAIWNVALSDGEVAALAAGLDPRLLQSRRASLAAFWPLIGASPEPDVIGGKNMTITGATRSDDPGNLITGTGRSRPNGNRFVYAA